MTNPEQNSQSQAPEAGSGKTAAELMKKDESVRGEVSAATIARMMGLATVSELKLLEGKIDLLSTKMSTVVARVEKALTVLNGTPTGSDLERIDVQIGALRSLIKDVLVTTSGDKEGASAEAPKSEG